MSCQNLVCAACAGRVEEGRCPTCRASRAEVHQHGPTLPADALLWAALVLTVLLAALQLR